MPPRAGRSPTFQDPGTRLDGLAGTRIPASPIQQLLSFGESFDVDPDSRVSCGLTGTRVPGYPFQH